MQEKLATHYVSNKDFASEINIYRKSYLEAQANSIQPPQMSESIGYAILRIANKLSTAHNFVGYSFKDEMIADGVMKCIRKIHLFDSDRSDNAFAYATQIIFNAFIERIKIERRQTSIKAKMVNEKLSSDFVMHGGMQDDPDFSNAFVEFLKDNEVLVDHYATTKDDKKFKVHDSLVHRNKTAYTKNVKVEDEAFDLTEFGI